MLDRKAAQANLEGIMQDIKGSMAGLYPSGFKPLLTRIEWENDKNSATYINPEAGFKGWS
jgi:hypothetical protein